MDHSLSTVHGVKILCVAEVRGEWSRLNKLADQTNASCIIHTGNFGFFDADSPSRIAPRTLRHIASFSPLLDPSKLPADTAEVKGALGPESLSELPSFLTGKSSFKVPVYTIYGASEDLAVLEKFQSGEYKVPNLHIIDELNTHKIETPSGINIRLMGIGGNVLLHRFFDNGDGTSTIAGTYGLTWTTALQIGQLIQTALSTFEGPEVRVFVSHPCPSREGILAQVALTLRADFTISSGLHFIYSSSFNEFTSSPTFDYFRGKLASARAAFMDVWETVKDQINGLVESDPKHKLLLNTCLDTIEKMPTSATGGGSKGSSSSTNDYLQNAFRSTWNLNLCDVQYGTTILTVKEDGKFGVETHSEGFDFSFRRNATGVQQKRQVQSGRNSKQQQSAAPGSGHQLSGDPSSRSAPPEANGTSGGDDAEKRAPPAPGVWLSSVQGEEDDVRGAFAEQDRDAITKVDIKESFGHPDKKYALVYFNSADDAASALDRIDSTKLSGRASLISANPRMDRGPRPRGGFGPSRGGSRGGRGGFRPGSRGGLRGTS